MSLTKKLMVFCLIIFPITLMMLPANFFDIGKTVCLSQSIFGIKCYGCGMTKAVMHFIHLDFEAAWHFNKLSYPVVLILSLLWLRLLLKQFGIHILKQL